MIILYFLFNQISIVIYANSNPIYNKGSCDADINDFNISLNTAIVPKNNTAITYRIKV